jgi:hypothetical protein
MQLEALFAELAFHTQLTKFIHAFAYLPVLHWHRRIITFGTPSAPLES